MTITFARWISMRAFVGNKITSEDLITTLQLVEWVATIFLTESDSEEPGRGHSAASSAPDRRRNALHGADKNPAHF